MRALSVIVTMVCLSSLARAADEKTWVLLTSAKEPDGKHFIMQAGVTEKTADAIIQYARDVDESLEKVNADIRTDICANKEFYAAALEHLANKIDESGDSFDSARAALIDELYTKLDEDEAAKLKKFKDEEIHVSVLWKPERYGNPIRYGQYKADDAINTICKE